MDVKEHLVRKFYANTTQIAKGTKVTKVRNLKAKFDQRTLNTYLGLEDLEPNEYLAKLAEKDDARPWLAKILIPGPTPP